MYQRYQFRWFPREDWIVLYDICSSNSKDLLGKTSGTDITNSLVHSTHLNWLVIRLHLGYDIQVTDKEKRKGIKTLDLSKFILQ